MPDLKCEKTEFAGYVYANCCVINEMNIANNISFKIGHIMRRNGNLAEPEDGRHQSSFVN